jgi:hypothetical protein
MGIGWLFAISLPGLVWLLVALAALERFGLWARSSSYLPWRRGRRVGTPLSAIGFEEFDATFSAGKRIELEARRSHSMLRDDEDSGAPPRTRIDLDHGIATMIRHPG